MTNQQTTTRNGNSAPAPTPAPVATYNEAPASINLRFDYRGANVQLTLRDVSGSALLGKLDSVLDHLETMGATFNAAPARPSQVAPAGTPMCPDGHGPMSPSKKKEGQFFCPHVIAESAGKKIYCQQKVG